MNFRSPLGWEAVLTAEGRCECQTLNHPNIGTSITLASRMTKRPLLEKRFLSIAANAGVYLAVAVGTRANDRSTGDVGNRAALRRLDAPDGGKPAEVRQLLIHRSDHDYSVVASRAGVG